MSVNTIFRFQRPRGQKLRRNYVHPKDYEEEEIITQETAFTGKNQNRRRMKITARVSKAIVVPLYARNVLMVITGAPNDGFLLNTLKTLFRLSRVLWISRNDILSCAIKFVSVRSSSGNVSVLKITRASVLFS